MNDPIWGEIALAYAPAIITIVNTLCFAAVQVISRRY